MLLRSAPQAQIFGSSLLYFVILQLSNKLNFHDHVAFLLLTE